MTGGPLSEGRVDGDGAKHIAPCTTTSCITTGRPPDILTTNLAAVVCVCVDVCQCAKFDQFLPARSHF